jgi:tetratricopeptide (TPR) repeat protein
VSWRAKLWKSCDDQRGGTLGWVIEAKLLRAAAISGAIALLGCGAISVPPVRAQSVSGLLPPDPLFQAMLSTPSNFDTTLRYAVSAKQRGDLEAAIGALERLLYYNSNLSRVEFELGTLYFRLGSYQMARGYFQSVLNAVDATAEMRARAQEYLDEIEKRLQPDQLSGYAQTGFRYQTNASYGATQQSLLGATRPINSQLLPQPDGNWFGVFAVNYVHDFENQSGDVFEANVVGYTAQQFNVSAVDTDLLDIRVGPRFGIFLDELNGASIKPYAVATGMLLANTPYLGSFGGGVTMHFNLANIALDPYAEFRQMDYHSTSLYPLASGLTGSLVTVALQAAGIISENVRWQARWAFYSSNDASPWFSYNRYAFDIWFPCAIVTPWGGPDWVLTPSFTVSPWLYRQPDPAVAPFVTEHAFEWGVGAGLDIPLKDQFGLGVAVQYRASISNIPGNTVRDLAVTLGPAVRF